MRLIRVFPLAWLTKYTVFTFPFPGSGSLLWIFPWEYSSTDSKQHSTGYDWSFLSQLELSSINKCNQIQPGNYSCFRRSCSWTYKINKLLVSPNERLNNIILERTIQYNTTQPQNSTAKESNAISEIQSTLKERPKSTLPAHVLTCLSHVLSLSHLKSDNTSLLAVTMVNNFAMTCPCKNEAGWPFLCPYRNVAQGN